MLSQSTPWNNHGADTTAFRTIENLRGRRSTMSGGRDGLRRVALASQNAGTQTPVGRVPME